MMVQWEYDDLGVDDEVQRFLEVFETDFGFHVKHWKIPSSRPTLELTQIISSWVKGFDDQQKLLILYYAGHRRLDDGRQVLWRK